MLFRLRCGLGRRRSCSLLRSALRNLGLGRRRDRLGLHLRQGCGRDNIRVQIRNGTDCFRCLQRRKFVGNRSGETLVHTAAAASAAPTGTALAAPLLFAADKTRLLLALVLVAVAVLDRRVAGLLSVDCLMLVARLTRFAATAAAPTPAPAPPAALALTFLLALAFACGSLFSEPFGLLGFHLGLELGIERLFLVEAALGQRRCRSSRLGCQQRLRRLERVDLLAAVDDVGL